MTARSPLAIANRLAKPSRDLLLDHIDHSCEVPFLVDHRENFRIIIRGGLIRAGLLEYRPTRQPRGLYIARTYITDLGRAVLAFVLAGYAEALIRAGATGVVVPDVSIAKPTPPVIADPPTEPAVAPRNL